MVWFLKICLTSFLSLLFITNKSHVFSQCFKIFTACSTPYSYEAVYMHFHFSTKIWKQPRVCVLCELLSRVLLSVTPWTVAHQAPLPTGILQARVLEWVAMPSSRGSSPPRDQTQVSRTAGRFWTIWATREAQVFNGYWVSILKDEKNSGDGWWWWLYKNMTVQNISELYTQSGYDGTFYMCLPQ